MKKVKEILNKMKELIKNNKKVIVPSLLIVVILAVVIGVGVVIAKAPKSNEKELNAMLQEMAKDFYENYWYDSVKEKEKHEVMERLSITGLSIDLDNLGRYNAKINEEKIKEFVNAKTKEECNKSKTKIKIYPNAPYGKYDYTIETELDCGFNAEEK